MSNIIMGQYEALVFKAKKYRELSYALLWGLLILPVGLIVSVTSRSILFVLVVLAVLIGVGLWKNFRNFTYWGITGLVAVSILWGGTSMPDPNYSSAVLSNQTSTAFGFYIGVTIWLVFFLVGCWVSIYNVILGKKIRRVNRYGEVALEKSSKKSIVLGTIGIILGAIATVPFFFGLFMMVGWQQHLDRIQ